MEGRPDRFSDSDMPVQCASEMDQRAPSLERMLQMHGQTCFWIRPILSSICLVPNSILWDKGTSHSLALSQKCHTRCYTVRTIDKRVDLCRSTRRVEVFLLARKTARKIPAKNAPMGSISQNARHLDGPFPFLEREPLLFFLMRRQARARRNEHR